jgi:hypothetical protein
MKRTALAATLTLLAACETGGAADVCAPWRAIYVAAEDVLTRQTAERILAHNETGRALCQWGKP